MINPVLTVIRKTYIKKPWKGGEAAKRSRFGSKVLKSLKIKRCDPAAYTFKESIFFLFASSILPPEKSKIEKSQVFFFPGRCGQTPTPVKAQQTFLKLSEKKKNGVSWVNFWRNSVSIWSVCGSKSLENIGKFVPFFEATAWLVRGHYITNPINALSWGKSFKMTIHLQCLIPKNR